MSHYSHTIIECTRPELIASGSTFVKESESMFHETIKSKSHFFTWRKTMDEEIASLSAGHPEETITSECHWDKDSPNSLIYKKEYKNGIQKLLGVEPEYFFCLPHNVKPDKKHIAIFKEHVLKYLTRLDVVNKVAGEYEIDRLDGQRDKHGYISNITITCENDKYIWSAEKNGSAYISVSVETKKPKPKRQDIKGKNSIRTSEDYDNLPF